MDTTAKLSDLHHLFIHAMLLRRVAPHEKWLQVWKKSANIVGERVTDNQFVQFYGEINERIEPFGFRIDLASDEGLGPIDLDSLNLNSSTTGSSHRPKQQTKRWMALVNTRSDDSAKLGTEFNPNELSLYKKIVDRIILSSNYRYCIPYHDALRLSSKLQTNLKKSDAEKLLKVLVQKGWLYQSSKFNFTLSIRAKMELKSYINENFEEESRPPICAGCREFVMRGFKCPNSECPKALHVNCALNQSRHSKTCPSCKSPFNYNILIGENAPKGDDDGRIDEEEEEEEEEGEGDTTATQQHQQGGVSQTNHRRSKRTRDDVDSKPLLESQSTPQSPSQLSRRRSDRLR